MAVSKVTLNGTTLMDVTDATATDEDIVSGATAYKANGAKGVGTFWDSATAITTVPDSYTLPVSDGTDHYKVTAGNLRKIHSAIDFSSILSLTSQVDDLGNNYARYFGELEGTGQQSVIGLPANKNYFVDVLVRSNLYKKIVLYDLYNSGVIWQKAKDNGTWGNWQLISGVVTPSVDPVIPITTLSGLSTRICPGFITFALTMAASESTSIPANTVLITLNGLQVAMTCRCTALLGTSFGVVSVQNDTSTSIKVVSNSTRTLSAGDHIWGTLVAPISTLTMFG